MIMTDMSNTGSGNGTVMNVDTVIFQIFVYASGEHNVDIAEIFKKFIK